MINSNSDWSSLTKYEGTYDLVFALLVTSAGTDGYQNLIRLEAQVLHYTTKKFMKDRLIECISKIDCLPTLYTLLLNCAVINSWIPAN